jgi:hypothetical protein
MFELSVGRQRRHRVTNNLNRSGSGAIAQFRGRVSQFIPDNRKTMHFRGRSAGLPQMGGGF